MLSTRIRSWQLVHETLRERLTTQAGGACDVDVATSKSSAYMFRCAVAFQQFSCMRLHQHTYWVVSSCVCSQVSLVHC